MPGNKKNQRVGKGRAGALMRATLTKLQRARDIVTAEDRIRLLANALPMGHPEHAHKIDQVFGPIEHYLDDMERTGESLVTGRGEAAVVDPATHGLVPAGAEFLTMHGMFSVLVPGFGWGPVPDGLRRMGAKLDAGALLFPSDMTDARMALTWMRGHVIDVTPNDWSAALAKLVELSAQAQPA